MFANAVGLVALGAGQPDFCVMSGLQGHLSEDRGFFSTGQVWRHPRFSRHSPDHSSANRKISLSKLLQISFPFDREHLPFGIVALLAAGSHVAFGRLAPPGYGHDMVHGEISGCKRTLTVAAHSFGKTAPPPLGFS